MKIFISTPMSGLSDELIKDNLKYFKEELLEQYPDAEIVHGYSSKNKESSPVKAFANAVQKLADCDTVALCGPHAKLIVSRGCRLERMIAKAYGLNIIEINS